MTSMPLRPRSVLVRGCLVAAGATAGTGLGLRLLLAGAARPAGVADAVVLVATVALAGCLAWGWLGTLAVVAEAVAAAPRLPRPALPARWRRWVLACCGAATLAVLAPAAGATPTASSGTGLDGLPYPERPVDGPARPRTVVVAPGDSLWAITARRLPPGADDAAITRGWHRLHERNRGVVGPDPDLILPGQRLALPAADERSTR
ncbi:LysM peptidoglycan-binding domain-containing protein [Nocardioides sp. SYSU D00038]|uniref:LysM peptidoglycan-binding domain-containing protein n=1 Tax=Nocardioides sp. SYSU D00038 TaxID=2812554 RepID=UPI001967BBF1|nr:hypothetical protein [Nocardioides sp. SYSU D00038]